MSIICVTVFCVYFLSISHTGFPAQMLTISPTGLTAQLHTVRHKDGAKVALAGKGLSPLKGNFPGKAERV